ncbi:MAG: GNAT family N-acetyltransferase [Candidatus Sumerlaeaceae bacterium]
MILHDPLLRDYNIAYSRRRFLKPMVTDAELREMAELEKLCFPPPENYDLRTLRMFVSLNGAGLIRRRELVDGVPRLIAFHLFDCLAGELITLDVHPQFRRMGIGKILVTESLKKLKELGHQQVTCQISVTNKPSLELHYAFGFKPVRTIRNYYGPSRDAFLLAAPVK